MKECSLQYIVGDLRRAIKQIRQLEFIHGPGMLQRNSDSQFHGNLFTHFLGEYAGIKLPPGALLSDPVLFEWRQWGRMSEFPIREFVITTRGVYRKNVTTHLVVENKQAKGVIKILDLELISIKELLDYGGTYPPFIEFFCERVDTIAARIEKFKLDQPKSRRRKFDWPKKIRSSLHLRKC